jgi:hypothetical protein
MFWALISVWLQVTAPGPREVQDLFARGRTIDQFVTAATAERDRWVKNAADASAPPDLVARLARLSNGLQILAVAEDWCLDSVNTVPYLAALASRAGIEFRIVQRADAEWLLKRHPAPDGRTATPTIILLRNGMDDGAWVERPAVLQRLFQSMAQNPENAQRFAARQAWYDADRGRTAMAEFVARAEHSK